MYDSIGRVQVQYKDGGSSAQQDTEEEALPKDHHGEGYGGVPRYPIRAGDLASG